MPVRFTWMRFHDGQYENYQIELVKFNSWPDLIDALNTGSRGASVLIQLAMKAKEGNRFKSDCPRSQREMS